VDEEISKRRFLLTSKPLLKASLATVNVPMSWTKEHNVIAYKL